MAEVRFPSLNELLSIPGLRRVRCCDCLYWCGVASARSNYKKECVFREGFRWGMQRACPYFSLSHYVLYLAGRCRCCGKEYKCKIEPHDREVICPFCGDRLEIR